MQTCFIAIVFLMIPSISGAPCLEEKLVENSLRYAIKMEQSELEDGSYQWHYRLNSPKRHDVLNSLIQYTDPGKFSTNLRNGAWSEEEDGSVEVTVTITLILLPPAKDQTKQRIKLKIVQASNLGKAYTSHTISLEKPVKHLDDVIGDSVDAGWINVDEQITLLTLNKQPIQFTLETKHSKKEN